MKGNIRDYATINELICLSNMENINAVLINDGLPQEERLVKLNQIAIQQIMVDGNGCRLSAIFSSTPNMGDYEDCLIPDKQRKGCENSSCIHLLVQLYLFCHLESDAS